MDVGESLGWIARGILDSHMRTLCGLAEPAELNVPFYIFDSSNANDAGTPGGLRPRLRRRARLRLPHAVGP